MNDELKIAEYSADSIADSLERVRAGCPLVHNITNYVVMNTTANALLALGASPVMADAMEEVEEITSASGALVLNIGTLSGRWVEAMLLAGRCAARCAIPIVLDPVGTGFSSYRTDTILKMLGEFTPSVIKGNPSEIQVLSRACGFIGTDVPKPRGADSASSSREALESAAALSNGIGCTTVVTGPFDYITDGVHTVEVRNGAEIMTRTTGMGCTASAVTAAFEAVDDNSYRAAVSAMAVMGIAGQKAAEHSAGNGSFQANFLDTLYNLDRNTIADYLKINYDGF